jgi:acetolactate synthase regulatory subunit
VIATLCVLGVAVSAAAADRGLKGRKYVEDEVIVKFKSGVIVESVRAMAGATVPGAFVVKSMAMPTRAGARQLALLRAPRGKAKVEELVAQFSALYDVEYVEPATSPRFPMRRRRRRRLTWPARTFAPGWRDVRAEISGEPRRDGLCERVLLQWGFACRR